jgi:hypothetical protein
MVNNNSSNTADENLIHFLKARKTAPTMYKYKKKSIMTTLDKTNYKILHAFKLFLISPKTSKIPATCKIFQFHFLIKL